MNELADGELFALGRIDQFDCQVFVGETRGTAQSVFDQVFGEAEITARREQGFRLPAVGYGEAKPEAVNTRHAKTCRATKKPNPANYGIWL